MEIPKDMQEQIINLFCNTKTRIVYILQKVAPNNEITLEELYDFIEHYRTKDGKKLFRPGKSKNDENKEKNKRIIKYNDEICEEIYKLREEQKKSYRSIVNILNKKDIPISISTVARISDEQYEKNNNVDKQKNKYLWNLETEIYKLMKKGMSYVEIINYFKEKNIDISDKRISKSCRRMYEETGKEKYKSLGKYKGVDNEMISILRTQHSMTYKAIADLCTSNGTKVSGEAIRQRLKKMEKDNERINSASINKKSNVKEAGKAITYKNKEKLISLMLNVAKKKKATQEQLKIFANEVSKIYGENIDLDFQEQNDERDKEI